MENYPTPPYNSYGDTLSDMPSGQAFLDLGLDLDLDSEAMPVFSEPMAGTSGYLSHQDYIPLGYPHQGCSSPSVIDPTGGNSGPNMDTDFSNFIYENYGGMPGVPSPAPTVTSGGITTPGTTFNFPRALSSPHPQAIGPRVSQCESFCLEKQS